MTRGVFTSEFYVTIVMTALVALMPDLPQEAFATVIAYILSRGLAKFGKR